VHSAATTLDLVTHQKSLNFTPGAEYSYSNTGYSLLGIIVQRVSGQSLNAFTQARLFQPLGMTHTRWRDDFTAVVKGRTTAYSGTAERGFKTDMSFTNMIGNGGLLTTVGDLLRWNENFFNPSIGGRAFVDSLQRRMVLRTGRRISYALGLEVSSYDGVGEVSHSGATAGYRTFLARYPDQHVSLAVLCNLGSTNPIALGHQVADLVITKPAAAAQSGTPEVTLTAPQVAQWTGTYVDRRTDRSLRLGAHGSSLINEDAPNAELRAIAPNVFRIPGNAELVLSGSAPIRTAKIIRPDEDTMVFAESRAQPLPAARLAEYVGTYASEELDVRLIVAVKDGALVLHRRPADEMAMRPIYDDDFGTPIGSLRFSRDVNGRITGFGIFSGRIRDVKFSRVSVDR
jgi:hypothetical protein